MTYLISIKLDIEVATRLLNTIGHEPEDADKIELCNAITLALEDDDEIITSNFVKVLKARSKGDRTK